MPTPMNEADIGIVIRLEPEAAVDYFRAKGYEISWDWQEVKPEVHARAFTVAKATSMDVLTTLKTSLDEALATGVSEQEWMRQVMPELKRLGWWGKSEVTHENGEVQEVTLGSPHRLRTIYRTNMTTTYQAGRYLQQQALPERPYWQYVAVLDERTRTSHRAMNGQVFPADDPIWQTHYPPNDWGCRCRVRAMSQLRLDSLGLTPQSSDGALTTQTVEFGTSVATGEVYETEVTTYSARINGETVSMTPGAGWSYNVGAAAFGTDIAVAQKLVEMQNRELRKTVIQSLNNAPARQAAYETWVDGVLAARRPGASVQPVAFLEESWAEEVYQRTGRLAARLLVLNERQLIHSDSDKHKKGGIAISQEEYYQLPAMLRDPELVLWDNVHQNLMVVVPASAEGEERMIKIIVSPNYSIKKQPDSLDLVINAYYINRVVIEKGIQGGELEVIE